MQVMVKLMHFYVFFHSLHFLHQKCNFDHGLFKFSIFFQFVKKTGNEKQASLKVAKTMETKLIVKLPFEGLRIRPKSNPNDNKANSNKTLSSKERVRKYRQCLQNDTNLKEKT